MADYEFRYAPLTGRLTGKQMIEQTEQAINGLAGLVDEAAGQVEIISTLANEANENAANALETAEEALATTGRTYITVSIPANANDYYDSQLIYIADNTSTNIPVADTGMLETKTNDNKTACEQVFIADSSGEAYYRHGDITAETVGDVTTYTVTWGGWSSEPASRQYVQEELASYLPLAGGTMTGTLRLASGANTIYSNVDDSRVGLSGGMDGTSAYLNLYGKNNASYTGRFSLTAYDGTSRKSLVGLPDGTLTWANENVLTDATVGTVRTNSNSSNVNLDANTTTKITSVTLSAGTWVVTGHLQYTSVVTRQFASLNDSATLNAGVEGTAVHYAGSSSGTTLALCVTRIFVLTSSTEIRLNGFASVACTAGTSHITAVRIV